MLLIGVSHRDSIPEGEYVAALIQDLEQSILNIWGRKLSTISFLVGGPVYFLLNLLMPSLQLSGCYLLPIGQGAEITMEANSGIFEADKFNSYQDAGVN